MVGIPGSTHKVTPNILAALANLQKNIVDPKDMERLAKDKYIDALTNQGCLFLRDYALAYNANSVTEYHKEELTFVLGRIKEWDTVQKYLKKDTAQSHQPEIQAFMKPILKGDRALTGQDLHDISLIIPTQTPPDRNLLMLQFLGNAAEMLREAKESLATADNEAKKAPHKASVVSNKKILMTQFEPILDKVRDGIELSEAEKRIQTAFPDEFDQLRIEYIQEIGKAVGELHSKVKMIAKGESIEGVDYEETKEKYALATNRLINSLMPLIKAVEAKDVDETKPGISSGSQDLLAQYSNHLEESGYHHVVDPKVLKLHNSMQKFKSTGQIEELKAALKARYETTEKDEQPSKVEKSYLGAQLSPKEIAEHDLFVSVPDTLAGLSMRAKSERVANPFSNMSAAIRELGAKGNVPESDSGVRRASAGTKDHLLRQGVSQEQASALADGLKEKYMVLTSIAALEDKHMTTNMLFGGMTDGPNGKLKDDYLQLLQMREELKDMLTPEAADIGWDTFETTNHDKLVELQSNYIEMMEAQLASQPEKSMFATAGPTRERTAKGVAKYRETHSDTLRPKGQALEAPDRSQSVAASMRAGLTAGVTRAAPKAESVDQHPKIPTRTDPDMPENKPDLPANTYKVTMQGQSPQEAGISDEALRKAGMSKEAIAAAKALGEKALAEHNPGAKPAPAQKLQRKTSLGGSDGGGGQEFPA